MLDRAGGQRHAPAALPPGKDPVPVVQEAGWAPGPIQTVANISPPLGFDPRTVRNVASRYTDRTRGNYKVFNEYLCIGFG